MKNVLNFDDDSELKAEVEAMVSDEEKQVRYELNETSSPRSMQKQTEPFISNLKNT